jgi:hypothetical protein
MTQAIMVRCRRCGEWCYAQIFGEMREQLCEDCIKKLRAAKGEEETASDK